MKTPFEDALYPDGDANRQAAEAIVQSFPNQTAESKQRMRRPIAGNKA
jgi:hypothetical protein